jgi:GxxExxY protein
MEVHRELGSGFLEAVYHEAMALEMAGCGIPFKREVELPVFYKGRRLETCYRVDFFCFGAIPVELKALSAITTNEVAQELNYLKASGRRIGLLLNFGAPSLQFRRFINTGAEMPSEASAQSVQSVDAS